jgi:peptide methionine sulfoxide reductase MsrB
MRLLRREEWSDSIRSEEFAISRIDAHCLTCESRQNHVFAGPAVPTALAKVGLSGKEVAPSANYV